MTKRRAGAYDQKLAQIAVAHLGDAPEPRFAAGRVLARFQAAASSGRAIVREPKEVERLRLAETSSAASGNCLPAELDEPRLFGMEAELEIGHAR